MQRRRQNNFNHQPIKKLTMKIEIKNRWTESIIFSVTADSMKLAVKLALEQKTDLRGADLRGADLRDADLRDADLRGADLRGADLRGADLRDADLRGADLRDAVLRGADLRDAVLRGADLRDADLRGADLRGADLRGADLRGADLRGADLSDAVLPFIPKIEDLDGKILAAIGKEGCALDMESWHVCETTHCRAGWAIHLSGDVGKTLESIYGPSAAGALIYATCYPKLKIPDFTASNEDALADMKQRAKLAK
jgi:uncharacterized protein YjbI with pentapeptide repeats